ncbi:nucleotide exchange factor GrpE [Staphylospora marina]|uniref:nucleotide exchange factor GrpE n=1 Tax=Staphylospora marina TaxID=2490858 RepID=UPI000F5B9857|nr:nucleotide exchange factor GrpE [Staphylospora marina]
MLDQEKRDFQQTSGEYQSQDAREPDTRPERLELHSERMELHIESSDWKDSADVHSPESEIERLRAELEDARRIAADWKAQAEEAREQLLRNMADFENFRKRARKDKEEAVKYAAVPLLESLLPVLDNFERALDLADQQEHPVSPELEAFINGIDMVYRQFLQTLGQAGLSMIEAEGRPFNPYEHNAVMQVEAGDVESGTVVEELQTGYRYLDRVLRPAMVKVSV